MAFYVVYIEEAHTSDGWQTRSNVKEDVIFARPNSFDERAAVANACVKNLDIQFPAVIDDVQNSTERAYTAWPDRLYLIDKEGLIAYKSRPGPFGFKPKELATELQTVLNRPAQETSRAI